MKPDGQGLQLCCAAVLMSTIRKQYERCQVEDRWIRRPYPTFYRV